MRSICDWARGTQTWGRRHGGSQNCSSDRSARGDCQKYKKKRGILLSRSFQDDRNSRHFREVGESGIYYLRILLLALMNQQSSYEIYEEQEEHGSLHIVLGISFYGDSAQDFAHKITRSLVESQRYEGRLS